MAVIAPVSEQDYIDAMIAQQNRYVPFPDIEGRRPIEGLGLLLPMDVSESDGGFEPAVPQIFKDMANFMYSGGESAMGDAPMMAPEDAAMGLLDFTGAGVVAGTPARIAAKEAGDVMLGSAGGSNPFYNVSDTDYQAILKGAENTRRTQLKPNEVVNPDGSITRTAPSGLLFEDFGYGPNTKEAFNPLDVSVTYRNTAKEVAPKIIKPSDIEGSYVLNMPSDRSVANRQLLGINDEAFDLPVDAQGGYQFPFYDNDAWASEKNVINSMRKSILGVPDGVDVYGASSIMGPKATDFSHHVTDSVFESLKNAKIKKSDIKKFDDEMKSLYPDWVGVKSPKIQEYLFKDKQGKKRKAMANVMSKAAYRDVGFPNLVPIRVGTAADELAYVSKDITGQSNPTGMSMVKFNPEGVISRSDDHKTYKGQIQKSKDAPSGLAYEMAIPRILQFPDFFSGKRALGKDPMQDRRSFEVSSILQEQRPEVSDNIETFMDLYNRGLLFD